MSGGATRARAVRLRAALAQVEKGAALLRRKRESLVAELLARARPAVDSRRAIGEQGVAAYRALLDALSESSRDELRALGRPSRELRIGLVPVQAWGLRAASASPPPPVVRSLAARGAATGPDDAAAQVAAESFERLLEMLLAAAPEEQLMRRLGEALARTTRQVNTLEQRVVPGVRAALSSVRRTLDEREREERVRLQRLQARRKPAP